MKTIPLLFILFLLHGLVGCSSDSGGGSDTEDPTVDGDSNTDSGGALSNSELVGLAYQVANRGGQDAGDGGLHVISPEPQIVPSSVTAVPCSVGDLQISEQANETIYQYNNCENTSSGLNQRMDGQTVITSVDPAVGFIETLQTAVNELVMRFSLGDDFIEQRINGTHETSSNPGVNTLTESDIQNEMVYQCGEAQGSLTNQYAMTSQMEYTSGDTKYDTELAMSVSDYGAFDGDYAVSTLESVYYENDSAHPYMGKQEFTLPNEQILVIQYEASGLYIGDEFYPWDEFVNETPFLFPTTSNCFDTGTDSGSNSDAGFTATINGNEHSDPNAVINYDSSTKRLSFGSFLIVADQSRSISFHADEVDGPGTYIIPFMQYHEGVVTANPGDTENNTWIMQDFSMEVGDATIDVEVFGPDLIEGTFIGTLHPNEDNTGDQQHAIEITDGEFSLEPYTFE